LEDFMKASHLLAGVAALTFSLAASAQFSEGFNNVPGLTSAGWIQTNTGAAPTNPWFQGNSGVFAAQAGPADSYAGADFLSSASGDINNWLISPTLLLNNASVLSFYTRSAGTPGFADLLDVAFSAGNGSALGGFTVLGTIGGVGAYPTDWTQFSFALPDVATGRFAFHQRGTFDTADYLGVDSVNVTLAQPVPEPETYAMLAFGLAGLALVRRRRTR
jgi:hypothetical protein